MTRSRRPRRRPPSTPRAQAAPAPPTWLNLLLAAVVATAGLLVYINSFAGVMLFDDTKHIVNNDAIRTLSPVTQHLWGPRRPLVQLSLAVNYAASGLRVWGYHAFNLAVHLLAAVTLFGLVRRTLLRQSRAERAEISPALESSAASWLAFAVALLWVVHPLNTQSVTYLIQRGESMMGLFYLLTLYCTARGVGSPHRRWWYAAAIVACALGMGSKAVMVTAPLIALLYDRIFIAPSVVQALRQRWPLYAGLSATWVVLLFTGVARGVLSPPAGVAAGVGLGVQDSSPWTYALTQPGVILNYLRLAVVPHALCLDYDWPLAETAGAIVWPAVAITALLFATLWSLRRRPRAGFLGACFFVILAPTSSVIPIMDRAFEHRMYLPLVAVIALLVLGVRAALLRLGELSPAIKRLRVPAATGLLLAAVTISGLLTVRRNADYHSEETMWGDVVAKRPDNPRAHTNLGKALGDAGRHEEARLSYLAALRIHPDRLAAQSGLAVVLKRQRRYEEAVAEFRKALEIEPHHVPSHHALAGSLVQLRRLDEALHHYAETVRLRPDYAEAHVNYGIALRRSGRLDEAAEHYSLALQLKPALINAHHNLGVIQMQQNKLADALASFRAVIGADRKRVNRSMLASAHFHAGRILEQQQQLDQAIAEYESAVRIDPNRSDARQRLDAARSRRAQSGER